MQGLPVAGRLFKRFTDAALEAQISTQRATTEALKVWMATRPESEQCALKATTAQASHERETEETETAYKPEPRKGAVL